MKHPDVKLLRAVGMMIGAIVGVGVFGLPYAFAQSGVALGLVWLIAIGGLLTCLQLMFAEVALQTPGKQRLVGLTERYLGKHVRYVTLVALSSGIWGAMLAYLIVGGRFLYLLLGPLFGGPEFIYALIVWCLGSFMIFMGLHVASKIEVIVVTILVFLFLFIVLVGLPSIDFQNFLPVIEPDYFLPYGVILFAMAGIGIIPEMKQVLGRQAKKKLTHAVLIAMSVIGMIYLSFALTVVGVTGVDTTQTAFDGLIPIFGQSFGLVTMLLGSITIISIFMVLGIEMLNTLKYDFRLSHKRAWLITTGVPLLLFVGGVREFIDLVGFVGSVFAGTLGILIVLTYRHVRQSFVSSKKHHTDFPPVLIWMLLLLFVGGILLEIFSRFLT
jgi:tyrosine-specific transport protein